MNSSVAHSRNNLQASLQQARKGIASNYLCPKLCCLPPELSEDSMKAAIRNMTRGQYMKWWNESRCSENVRTAADPESQGAPVVSGDARVADMFKEMYSLDAGPATQPEVEDVKQRSKTYVDGFQPIPMMRPSNNRLPFDLSRELDQLKTSLHTKAWHGAKDPAPTETKEACPLREKVIQKLTGSSSVVCKLVLQDIKDLSRSDPLSSPMRECLQCRHCRKPFLVPAARLDSESARQRERSFTEIDLADHEVECAKRHCDNCCALFKSSLQLKGHATVCGVTFVKKCDFCGDHSGCRTPAEKRHHEAKCKSNPALRCEWCLTNFPHQALRNAHLRVCPLDPRKECAHCGLGQSSCALTSQHEVLCESNPAGKAKTTLCTACGDEARCAQFPCSHFYCAPCIFNMGNMALKDRSLLPLRCCMQQVVAGTYVDIVVGQLLSETSCKVYHEAMLVKSSKHVLYCPRKSCGSLIVLDELLATRGLEADTPFGCPTCKEALCFTCKSEWHDGVSCKQYQFLVGSMGKELHQLCKDFKWMRCFECGHVIEKKAGCNHMTCICGSQFCYLCGGAWGNCRCQVMGDGHTSRHNRTNGEQHTCQHCFQAYPSAMELSVHVRLCQAAIRVRGGAFECSRCHSAFPTNDLLMRHRRTCLSGVGLA